MFIDLRLILNYENYRDIKLALRLAFHPDFHYVIIIRSLNMIRIFIIKTNNVHSRVRGKCVQKIFGIIDILMFHQLQIIS